jgi:hypothetical protein
MGTWFTDRAALERPNAVLVQAIMFVISAVFVALCVRSFIAARRST